MTSCALGCCWTPWQACAQQRACACHWDDKRPAKEPGDGYTHRDPTARTAIRNVEIERKRRGR